VSDGLSCCFRFFVELRDLGGEIYMNICQIQMTTSEAPTQFEGRTSDDRPVYVRYRDGWLSVEVGRPGEADVFSGYVVYENSVITASGNDNAITWEEVQTQIASVNFREQIDQMELNEQMYRARWNEAFQFIQMRKMPNVILWTLHLADIPWVTPYENRVGRFDFELAMREHCQGGICAYVFTEPDSACCTITVLHNDETAGQLDAIHLALAGVIAFGGVRYGPSGGSGRGEAEGIRLGDADEAFAYVAACLAGA
jgi:hypothetical protein